MRLKPNSEMFRSEPDPCSSLWYYIHVVSVNAARATASMTASAMITLLTVLCAAAAAVVPAPAAAAGQRPGGAAAREQVFHFVDPGVVPAAGQPQQLQERGWRAVVPPAQKEPSSPLMSEQEIWEVRWDNTYPTTRWDEQAGIFKMWYGSSFTCDRAPKPSDSKPNPIDGCGHPTWHAQYPDRSATGPPTGPLSVSLPLHHSLSLSLPRSFSLARSFSRSFFLSLSLSLSLSLCLALSLPLSLSLPRARSLSRSLSLSRARSLSLSEEGCLSHQRVNTRLTSAPPLRRWQGAAAGHGGHVRPDVRRES
eukprot:SAG22_NODE_227_length_14641_cov_11.007908_8_plen_308_part_00